MATTTEFMFRALAVAVAHIYFTSYTLSRSSILRLSICAMSGLLADKSRSQPCVLTAKRFRTTKDALVKTDPVVLSTLSEELSPRQLMCGSCVALASSSHPAIEPLCCFTPTLSSAPARDTERGQDFLLCATSPYGMWPVLSGDDEEGT